MEKPDIHYASGKFSKDGEIITFADALEIWNKTESAYWSERAYFQMSQAVMRPKSESKQPPRILDWERVSRVTSKMNLRDEFAKTVLQSIFAGDGAQMVANRDLRYNETNWAEIVADNCYQMADAMIARRDAVILKQGEPYACTACQAVYCKAHHAACPGCGHPTPSLL